MVASSCSSAADQPPDVQLRRRAVASPDRVALAALDRDLQLDGAMSSPGPAAKLALKRQTGLMGGDMGLAATTVAAQAQRSASAAQPAAAAAAVAVATGAYDLQAMARASQSLPVVPARSSTTGRPAAPPHPFLVAGRGRGRGRGAARGGARRGRGRGRGRASDGTGKYPCESCGERVKDRRTLKKSHYKEYTWVGADGEKVTKRLCKNNDWDQRQALDKLQKATTARHQPGQSALSFPTSTTSSSVTVTSAVSVGASAPAPQSAPLNMATANAPAPSPAPAAAAAAAAAPAPAPAVASATMEDQFGFEVEEGAYIVSPTQDKFWAEEVLPHLSDRERSYTNGKLAMSVSGEWKLNGGGLIHHPPDPMLNRAAISVDACCLVPVLVWAPTLSYPDIAADHSANMQAPCPHGGFNCDVIHKGCLSLSRVY